MKTEFGNCTCIVNSDGRKQKVKVDNFKLFDKFKTHSYMKQTLEGKVTSKLSHFEIKNNCNKIVKFFIFHS